MSHLLLILFTAALGFSQNSNVSRTKIIKKHYSMASCVAEARAACVEIEFLGKPTFVPRYSVDGEKKLRKRGHAPAKQGGREIEITEEDLRSNPIADRIEEDFQKSRQFWNRR